MLTTAPTNKLAPESLGSLQIYQYKHFQGRLFLLESLRGRIKCD